jgi:inner membrane protein
MDNLTHTLYGLALAKTGLQHVTPQATWTLVVGANLPDVDLASLFWGQISYLKYHRAVTHSLAGGVLGALLLASIIYWVNNRLLKKAPASWWKLFGLGLIGIASHIFLDYTNSYGIRPLLPFKGRWYAWDTVFIIDPWILLVLVLGLGLPFLFGLISQEIGAKPSGPHRGAILCLVVVLFYWLLKDLSHRQALAELSQGAYSTGTPLRVAALPKLLDPFGWNGIVETETAYHKTELGWTLFDDDYPSDTKVVRKTEQRSIVESASKGPTAQIFLDFARFPWFQIEPSEEGYTVSLRDLRFDFASRIRRGFTCTISLNQQLRLVSEEFHF